MKTHSTTARRVLVRRGYTDEDIYRSALPQAHLYSASTDGPTDAPDFMPAGSHRSSNYGPQATFVFRQDAP